MADIIERSLNLSVTGEDLAADVFAALADEVLALEERFETSFAAMASYAEDAASAIADAANLWAPQWVSQLTQLESLGVGAFAAVGDAAVVAGEQMTTAGSSGASAATIVESAWLGPLETLSEVSGNADAVSTAFDGTASSAATAAEKISGSFSTDSLGLDAAKGSLADLDDQFAATAGDASTAAEKISGSFDTDSLGLDAAKGSLADLDDQFSTTARDASTAADKISGSFDTDSLGLDAAQGSLSTLDTQFSTAADSAATAAKTISGSFDTDSLGLDAAKGSLTSLDKQFAASAVDAQTAAKEIEDAYAGIDVTAGGTAAVAGAAGEETALAGGAGLTAQAKASEEAAKSGESVLGDFSLGDTLSSGLMGSILGGMALGGASMSVGGIQEIGLLAEQLGVSPEQALAVYMSSSALQPSGGTLSRSSNIDKAMSRLENSLQKVELQNVPELEGKPISIGMGRMAVEPASLSALLASSSVTSQDAALSLLFGSPRAAASMLQGEDATTQLEQIATKLDAIKSANEKTQIANDLFGTRGGVTMLPLLEHFQQAMTDSLSKIQQSGIMKDLGPELGSKGMTGAMNYEEQLKLTEVQMETALVKLTPALEALVKEISLLIDALAHPGSVKSLETIAEDAAAIAAGVAAKNVVSKGVKGLAKKAVGAVGDLAGDVGGSDLVGSGVGGALDVASKLLGPAGMAASFLAFPSGMANDTSQFAKFWQANVAPHVGQKSFSTTQTESAITMAAKAFGLDPAAMMSDSYAESSLNPNAYNKSSHATGVFQFIPSTWASDTKRLLGQSLPFSEASNPYVSSMVAAASMSKMGIGGMHGEQALKNMIGDLPGVTASGGAGFEHPGSSGAQGDLSRGLPFLQQLEQELSKADKASKTHSDNVHKNVTKGVDDAAKDVKAKAPDIPKEIAAELNKMIDEAKKQGGQFSSANEKYMEDTLKILEAKKPAMTATAENLMKGLLKGLENQEGPLTQEAQKIANEIEKTLNAALKIKSPSELTAEMGEQLMAGLGVGFERAAPGAAHGMGSVATRTVQGIHPALGGGSGGGSGQPIVIQVQSILDGKVVGQSASSHIVDVLKLIGKTP